MSIFTSILQQAAQPPQRETGDYIGPDGFLYCGKCHTPKERPAPAEIQQFLFHGQPRNVKIVCKCEAERQEKEEAENRLLQRKQSIKDQIATLQSMGAAIIPKHTFSDNDGANAKNTRLMTLYAERFDEVRKKNGGLMLYGNPGAGKSFFAECVANKILDDGLFAWMTTIKGISEAMKLDRGEARKMLLHYVENVDLLILDDFGSERGTEYMAEQVLEIVNARTMASLPLIVTTNLDPATMHRETDITYMRIYERIFEMCSPVKIEGTTRRAGIAARKIADLKDILGME